MAGHERLTAVGVCIDSVRSNCYTNMYTGMYIPVFVFTDSTITTG